MYLSIAKNIEIEAGFEACFYYWSMLVKKWYFGSI
jgi:hypothetical protein